MIGQSVIDAIVLEEKNVISAVEPESAMMID
jgi:hypothetical protein